MDSFRLQAMFLLFVLLLPAAIRAEDRRQSTVGMPARIEGLVLPGPELEVKPLTDRRAPVVLRIIQVRPHGTAFRYDLEYYGLEGGKFDLKTLLRRKDASAAADLPPISVEIRSVLPAGQVAPHDFQPPSAPWLGGYHLLLIAGGLLWLLGLLALLLVGRRKKRPTVLVAAPPPTPAEHLRPLIEGAVAGRLTPPQLAELERALLIYWEHRLKLRHRKPLETLAILRRHREAGPLLRQLEIWLHQPGKASEVDVRALLEPYRHPLEHCTPVP
jgi:hypothetical protein